MPPIGRLVLALVFAGGLPVAVVGQKPSPAEVPVADLIRQLESDKFRDREAAQRALSARDDAAGPLRLALPTLSAEGQRRAKIALEAIGQRHAARFVRYARDGRIDLLVEWAAAADGAKAELLWQGVLDVGWEVVGRSLNEYDVRNWERRQFPERKFGLFLKGRPDFITDGDTLKSARVPTHLTLHSAGKLTGQGLEHSLVLAAGPVHLEGSIASNVIFATDDVTVLSADRVLIIADGNVDVKVCDTAVVIARGAVSVRTALEPDRTAVRADGGIKLSDADQMGLLLRPPPAARPDDPPRPAPPREVMNRVRFFELSDLGLEVAPRAGVKVTAVRAGSPLAKGGLKPGDEFVAVDGDRLVAPESLRKVLRRAFVLGRAGLTIRRDGTTVTLDVSFVGWDLPAGPPVLAK